MKFQLKLCTYIPKNNFFRVQKPAREKVKKNHNGKRLPKATEMEISVKFNKKTFVCVPV